MLKQRKVNGQSVSRQLATSSENLVASTQFLVALATSESQFRALIFRFLFIITVEITQTETIVLAFVSVLRTVCVTIVWGYKESFQIFYI